MRNHSSKSKCQEKPLLFVIPAAIMLIFGFGVLIAYSFGGRFTATDSQLIPLGLTTVVVGAMSLSRTLLSTFFLFIYSVTAVVLIILEHGFASPWIIPFALLIFLCLPQAKHARR